MSWIWGVGVGVEKCEKKLVLGTAYRSSKIAIYNYPKKPSVFVTELTV